MGAAGKDDGEGSGVVKSPFMLMRARAVCSPIAHVARQLPVSGHGLPRTLRALRWCDKNRAGRSYRLCTAIRCCPLPTIDHRDARRSAFTSMDLPRPRQG